MPFEQEEELAADLVEGLSSQYLNRQIGQRDRRDESVRGGLRIDFVYEQAQPPVALEITGMHGPKDRTSSAAARKLEAHLTSTLPSSTAAGWVVVLQDDASANALRPKLEVLLRDEREMRPGDYSSKELLEMDDSDRAPFLEEHRELQSLGLVAIERADSLAGYVSVMVVGGGQILGFGNRLTKAISQNESKLAEARPRETHLAIMVYDYQVSTFPSATAPPSLPDALDFLWVIFAWGERGATANSWVLRRGGSSWMEMQYEVP